MLLKKQPPEGRKLFVVGTTSLGLVMQVRAVGHGSAGAAGVACGHRWRSCGSTLRHPQLVIRRSLLAASGGVAKPSVSVLASAHLGHVHAQRAIPLASTLWQEMELAAAFNVALHVPLLNQVEQKSVLSQLRAFSGPEVRFACFACPISSQIALLPCLPFCLAALRRCTCMKLAHAN